MSCPICEKRKAERFCPAKGEKICAVCCGTEREVSIDCPPDCSYLIAAHRYEDQHQRSLPENTPLLDVKVPQDVIYTHQNVLSGLAFTAATFSPRIPPLPILMFLTRFMPSPKPTKRWAPESFMKSLRMPRCRVGFTLHWGNPSTNPNRTKLNARLRRRQKTPKFLLCLFSSIGSDCCGPMAVHALDVTSNSFAGSSLPLLN